MTTRVTGPGAHSSSLESMVRIDGVSYRLMGRSSDLEALPQTGLAVFPTRTVYDFEDAGVHIKLDVPHAAPARQLGCVFPPR